MNIKRMEVGFNEDYVRKTAKKERTNMLRIMRRRKQSQKEVGIWSRDEGGNLIRNDELTKEAVSDPSKPVAYCPYCKEDSEVDTVRGGIYGSGLGKPLNRCVVCGRQFEIGSTKTSQLGKEDVSYEAPIVDPERVDAKEDSPYDKNRIRLKEGDRVKAEVSEFGGPVYPIYAEGTIGYLYKKDTRPGLGAYNHWFAEVKFKDSSLDHHFWAHDLEKIGITNTAQNKNTKKKKFHCKKCNKDSWYPSHTLTSPDKDTGVCPRISADCPNCPDCGGRMTTESVGGEVTARASQLHRTLKTPLRYKERPNYRPYGGGNTEGRENADNSERTHCMNCSRDFGLANDGNCPFCGSPNISKITKKAKLFLKKTSQFETDEPTGTGDEESTISSATISLTSRGEQNLAMAREQKLPYDMDNTEISEEFWTLVTEELDTINNHPDISEIQWYKGVGMSPTYSEVYAFFLKSLDPLDFLSDNKTKVSDISGMKWLEAFATMHDNNMIEVAVEGEEQLSIA